MHYNLNSHAGQLKAKASSTLILSDLEQQDACPKVVCHLYVAHPCNTRKAPAIYCCETTKY